MSHKLCIEWVFARDKSLIKKKNRTQDKDIEIVKPQHKETKSFHSKKRNLQGSKPSNQPKNILRQSDIDRELEEK